MYLFKKVNADKEFLKFFFVAQKVLQKRLGCIVSKKMKKKFWHLQRNFYLT